MKTAKRETSTQETHGEEKIEREESVSGRVLQSSSETKRKGKGEKKKSGENQIHADQMMSSGTLQVHTAWTK